MRSPVAAILWENWRLTRVETASRLAAGLIGGSLGLLNGSGVLFAVMILLSQHGLFWLSTAKLNGGRFIDGYKPGFPFHLLYARPVGTGVAVGTAMAYEAASGVVWYLLTAATLSAAFGQSLPLLSIAVWIVAVRLWLTCVQWATHSRVVQYVGSGAAALFLILLMSRADWTVPRVDFTPVDYGLLAAAAVLSVGVTVAGVSRQRRGDPRLMVAHAGWLGRLQGWLAGLLPCPTSSPTRAQLWYELRSGGVMVIVLGAVTAMAIPLAFAVSGPIADLRRLAFSLVVMAWPGMLIFLGGNAFGLRRNQGRVFASTFDTTQPYGTARMSWIKVLVRSVCLMAALVMVFTSAWASLPLTRGWVTAEQWATVTDPYFGGPRAQAIVEATGAEIVVLWKAHHALREAVFGMAGHEKAALVVLVMLGVIALVSLRAAIGALLMRYRRRTIGAGAIALVGAAMLALLSISVRRGIGPAAIAGAILYVVPWIAMALAVVGGGYVLWAAFRERVLTTRHIAAVALGSIVSGAAWLVVLGAAGVTLESLPATDILRTVAPVLLLAATGVLTPWALSRIRHS
ncbi:MAG TPA: hypothetical protein VNZ57_08530 [Longimicrobiales bacterium]|nr:hypothetical protein [Longimicrobiales bacterium]